MCGIAGIIAKRAINPVAVEAMTAALSHRGPDGDGVWISPQGNIGLAHRRLAIVDLSDRAAQPMSDGDEKIWITFNGEMTLFMGKVEVKFLQLGAGHTKGSHVALGERARPDRDGHRPGGAWKLFDNMGNRLGTYNWDLSERIGP